MRTNDRSKWYIIPEHHPTIVEPKLFDAVQNKIRRFKTSNKKTCEYPLRSKVFCGCCLHGLRKEKTKNAYYYCRHSFGIESMDCNGVRYPAQELEQAIFETLKKQVEFVCPDGKFDAIPPVDHAADYEQQLTDLQDEKMQLYERCVLGELDVDAYREEKAAIEALILRTKNTYAAVKAQAQEQQSQHEKLVQRKQLVQEFSSADTLTQTLEDLLIDRVYVYPDKRIFINYKIEDIFEDVI